MHLTDAQQTLARLSNRPDIQSTLILSRTTGAIIKVTGRLLTDTTGDDDREPAEHTDGYSSANGRRDSEAVRSPPRQSATKLRDGLSEDEYTDTQPNGTTGSQDESAEIQAVQQKRRWPRSAERVATVVWRYLEQTRHTVRLLDEAEGRSVGSGEGDEMRLLRLRTRRYEAMIVPDDGFVLVVFHDVGRS